MYLLDTTVISELRKVRQGRADPQVAAWAEQVTATELFMSAISAHELELGVLLAERKDPAKGLSLRHWFEHQVLPAFAGRIIAVDLAVARRSVSLQVPNPRPLRDSLIAATALLHGLTVVTRDVSDFGPMQCAVLNPWQAG